MNKSTKYTRSLSRNEDHLNLSNINYNAICAYIVLGELPIEVVCEICKLNLDIHAQTDVAFRTNRERSTIQIDESNIISPNEETKVRT